MSNLTSAIATGAVLIALGCFVGSANSSPPDTSDVTEEEHLHDSAGRMDRFPATSMGGHILYLGPTVRGESTTLLFVAPDGKSHAIGSTCIDSPGFQVSSTAIQDACRASFPRNAYSECVASLTLSAIFEVPLCLDGGHATAWHWLANVDQDLEGLPHTLSKVKKYIANGTLRPPRDSEFCGLSTWVLKGAEFVRDGDYDRLPGQIGILCLNREGTAITQNFIASFPPETVYRDTPMDLLQQTPPTVMKCQPRLEGPIGGLTVDPAAKHP